MKHRRQLLRLLHLPEWPRLTAIVTLALLAGLALVPGRASAHAGFERSEPAENAVLAESPERVDIWFGQEMARNSGLPIVIVVNQAGDVIADEPVLDDDDRTHISIELPPELPPRRYTVIWHNLSDEDGEEAQGAFHFYVGQGPEETGEATPAGQTPAATASASPIPQPSDDSGDDGAPWWIVPIAAVVGIIVGAGGGFAMAGRRPGGRNGRPGGGP